MSDPLDALAGLREASDVALQVDERARGRLKPVTASDESGEVTIVLEADEGIVEVRVGFTWDRALRPEQLGPAVLAAAVQGRADLLEQYAVAVDDDEDPAPRARPAPTGTSTVVDALRARLGQDVDDPRVAADLLEELLDDARAGLDEANALLDEHSTREHVGRSPSRRVTARMHGNRDIVAVDIDQDWLVRAHPANLGREITAAVRSAQDNARRDGLRAALEASRLMTLARLATGEDDTDRGVVR